MTYLYQYTVFSLPLWYNQKLAQYWGAFGFLALFPGHSWGKPLFLTGKVEVLEDTGALELTEKGPIP